jgi:hypothetical protein
MLIRGGYILILLALLIFSATCPLFTDSITCARLSLVTAVGILLGLMVVAVLVLYAHHTVSRASLQAERFLKSELHSLEANKLVYRKQ